MGNLSFFKFSKEDILRGPVGKSLFLLSLPLVSSNLFLIAYHLIDTFWLGRVGSQALAAIAYALPVSFLVIATGGGIANAGAILIAQHKGAKNQREIDKAANQTFIFLILLSFFVTLFGFFTTIPLLRLLGASATILPLAQSYLQTIFLGIILMYWFIMARNFFRGIGDSVSAMWIGLFAVAINLVLDPFLIFGWSIFPRMEVQGAALSTVISRGLAALVGIILLFRGRMGIHISLQHLKPDFSYLGRLAKLGFPVSGEISARAIGIIIILPIISSFGIATVAAYGIGARFLTLFFMFALGISQALNTMVAQNLGAGQFLRAREVTIKAIFSTVILFFILGLVMFWQAEFLAGIFTNQIQIQKITAQFLRIISLSLGFFAIMRISAGAFRGGGATLAAMIITFSSIFIFLIPLAVIFSKFWGSTGIWWAFFASYVAGAVFAILWFFFGKWQKRLVKETR